MMSDDWSERREFVNRLVDHVKRHWKVTDVYNPNIRVEHGDKDAHTKALLIISAIYKFSNDYPTQPLEFLILDDFPELNDETVRMEDVFHEVRQYRDSIDWQEKRITLHFVKIRNLNGELTQSEQTNPFRILQQDRIHVYE